MSETVIWINFAQFHLLNELIQKYRPIYTDGLVTCIDLIVLVILSIVHAENILQFMLDLAPAEVSQQTSEFPVISILGGECEFEWLTAFFQYAFVILWLQ